MAIKIERNGVQGEVVDQYLQDFLGDGWKVIDAKKSASNEDSKTNKQSAE